MPTPSPSLKLIYFDLDGRAAVIRKTLSVGGVPFIDERVPRDLTPLKPSLPYSKVPVLEVDGSIFAETAAITRYAGRLAGLYPPASQPVAAAMVDEIMDSFDDLFERLLAPSFWESDPEKKKHMREELVQGPLPQAFERLDKRLATMAEYQFFKQRPSSIYVHDIMVWDVVEFMRSGKVDHIPTTFMDTYTTLIAMHDKVETPPSGSHPEAKPPAQAVTPPLPKNFTLTYFDMPGRAEQIRLAFHIGGIAFDDERLSFEEMSKRKADLPNGQVPVLRANDTVVLAQSIAILRYVGTLTGLYPVNDPITAMKMDEVLSHLGELYFALDPSFTEPDPIKKQKMREALVATTFPASLDGLNKRLEQWKTQGKTTSAFSLGGETPTIADLGIYSLIMFLQSGFLDHVPTTIVDQYTNIVKASEAVQQHPRVQDWYLKHPMPTA